MLYSCYGLAVDSHLPLPELCPLPASSAKAEVRVRVGGFSDADLEGGRQLGPFLWATRGALMLRIPGVARFLVRKGVEILIDPEPDVDEESIRVFLLGSALGALLLQRGHLVLHGNAIQIGHQCVVCVGRSGAGKSMLAAAFMRRGHSILADDVVAVDDAQRALPGIPRLKLWRESADRLGIDVSTLPRLRPGIEKYSYPLAHHVVDQPLPIRWVYHLDTHPWPEPELEPVHGMDRLQPLLSQTYRLRFVSGMGLEARHLQQCGRLAGQVRLARLFRPEAGGGVDALVDRILADANLVA